MRTKLQQKFMLHAGDVTIPAGVEYEIEANGVVRLEDGFSVASGATFAVYPSSF